MHLSNNNRIFAMIFYSLLTFFAGPYLAKPLVGNNPTVTPTLITICKIIIVTKPNTPK